MPTFDTIITPNLGPGWLNHLAPELEKPYLVQLMAFLVEENKQFIIYPPKEFVFNAFNSTDFGSIKVVILGQDPYHGFGQAHGLCFSVQNGVRVPPSLANIYKELETDCGTSTVAHGNLSEWAQQGVFLLNTTLTVREGQPSSHAGKGWEQFTDACIMGISQQLTNVVFMLWGKHAQDKTRLIDVTKHLILQAPHPSPFSAHKGFLGCKHFSTANQYLSQHGITPIQWQLSE